MKTKITELFDIEHPIIQGGMHYVGFAELAAAVSNAGGLGIITGLTQGTPEKLANEIAKCKDMTDKPFGVNLTFLPSLTPPDYPGLIKVIIEGGVKKWEGNKEEIASGEKADPEGYMTLRQIATAEDACKRIKMYIDGDKMLQLPGWVQAKMATAAADLDSVADYLVSDTPEKE